MAQIGAGYGFPSTPQMTQAIAITSSLGQGHSMFANPTTSLNVSVSALNTNTLSSVNGLIQGANGNIIPGSPGFIGTDDLASLQILKTNMTSLSGSFVSFQAHTDDHIGNIPSRMGIVDSNIHLSQTLTPQPAGSVCNVIQNFLGSILGAGLALLNQALAAIQNIANLIAQGISFLLAQINSIIATIAGFVSSILNMIAAEIAAIAAAIAQELNFAIGSLLANMPSSSCMNLLIGAIGTGTLAGLLASH